MDSPNELLFVSLFQNNRSKFIIASRWLSPSFKEYPIGIRSYDLKAWNELADKMSGKQSEDIQFENADIDQKVKPIAIAIAIRDFNSNWDELWWESTHDVKYLSLLKEEVVIVVVCIFIYQYS